MYQLANFVQQRNPYGKYLFEYVLDSGDNSNLLTFLMPKPPYSPIYEKKCNFWKMKSQQFYKLKGRSLFEHYLRVFAAENSLGVKFFEVILSLLDETSAIEDIRSEVPIDTLLELAVDEKFYMKLLKLDEDFDDDSKRNKMKRKRFIIDDLLGYIVAYWTKDDMNYKTYKNQLMQLGPFFQMMFEVIEDDKNNFKENFLSNIEKLESTYRERYNLKEDFDHYTTSFLFILLLTAMLNDRREFIDHILDYETFDAFTLKFPSNIECNESCQYVAQKLLEHGQITSSWISSEMFEDFLDSRVKYMNEDLVEIDCSFMLHDSTKKIQIESTEGIDNNLIFREDTDDLKFIMKSESFKQFLIHPVVSTYIELKSLKFRNIFLLNFWLFIVLFVAPFNALIFCSASDQSIWFGLTKFLCFVSIVFITIREGLQCFFFDSTPQKYLRRPNNWVEIALLVVSIFMLGMVYTSSSHIFGYEILPFLSVIIILLSTAFSMTMLPYQTMRLHLIMLAKACRSFLKFFLTFSLIFLAFTLAFCVIFKNQTLRSIHKGHASHANHASDKKLSRVTTNPNTDDDDSDEEYDDDDKDVFKNFQRYDTAFLKIVLMLSGEYTVEPFRLEDIFQIIVFFVFLLSTFIIFNFITGLTVNDVQELMGEFRYSTIEQKAVKFLKTSSVYRKIYRKFK